MIEVRIPVHLNYHAVTIKRGLLSMVNETKEPLLWCGYNEVHVENMEIEHKKAGIFDDEELMRPTAILYFFSNEVDATAFKLKWA